MPWSIEADGDRKEIEDLRIALDKASNKNIILFCAIFDKGNATPDNLYPGCMPTVISIGAATSTGGFSAIVQSLPAIVQSRNVQFILPGEDVEIDEKKNTADGSSIATALAAGMAAMLLHCTDKVMPEARRMEYYTPAAISRVFSNMGGTPVSMPRVREYFGGHRHEFWQQRLNTGEWKDLLRQIMLQTRILGL